MPKLALILHGWPGYRLKDYFLSKYLKEKGYEVLTPNMFVRGYVFTPENVLNEVKRLTNGREIDLIVGISLGGLILPYIAKEYPKSKLIFIATGTELKTNSWFFNNLIRVCRYTGIQYFAKLLLKLPNNVLRKLYKLASPCKAGKDEMVCYNKDMQENLNLVKSIPISEEREIIEFITKTENTIILSTIKNKSLIFNGMRDLMMSWKMGEKLHRLLKNSKLIINNGEHFNVFQEKDLKEVERFILYSNLSLSG